MLRATLVGRPKRRCPKRRESFSYSVRHADPNALSRAYAPVSRRKSARELLSVRKPRRALIITKTRDKSLHLSFQHLITIIIDIYFEINLIKIIYFCFAFY